MTPTKIVMLATVLIAGCSGSAFAQSGPVATSCAGDMGRLCAGKRHDGSPRICLERAYAKVSADCKSALDCTGGARAKRPGKGKTKAKAS